MLKPGGRYVMTSWCGPDVSPVFSVFYSAVQTHGSPGVKMPDSPNFHHFAAEGPARDILGAAGLRVDSMEQIGCYWDLQQPERLAEIFQQGAPRGGYLLSQQPEDHRTAIKAAVAAEVRERFAHGDIWRAPVPACLVVATAV